MAVGRVRTRREFAALAAGGRRARHGVVKVTFLAGGDQPRAAYAIGRTVGPAVVRNRVKRRLRAAVAELRIAPGTYLVAVDPAASRVPFGQLRDDLAAALRTVGAR